MFAERYFLAGLWLVHSLGEGLLEELDLVDPKLMAGELAMRDCRPSSPRASPREPTIAARG